MFTFFFPIDMIYLFDQFKGTMSMYLRGRLNFMSYSDKTVIHFFSFVAGNLKE